MQVVRLGLATFVFPIPSKNAIHYPYWPPVWPHLTFQGKPLICKKKNTIQDNTKGFSNRFCVFYLLGKWSLIFIIRLERKSRFLVNSWSSDSFGSWVAFLTLDNLGNLRSYMANNTITKEAKILMMRTRASSLRWSLPFAHLSWPSRGLGNAEKGFLVKRFKRRLPLLSGAAQNWSQTNFWSCVAQLNYSKRGLLVFFPF